MEKNYSQLDDKNSIIKKYHTVINYLATGTIFYVRRAGTDYFNLYTRVNDRMVIYTLTEIENKIKVHIRCEDIRSINLESELFFEYHTDQFTIAERCEELRSELSEKVIKMKYS